MSGHSSEHLPCAECERGLLADGRAAGVVEGYSRAIDALRVESKREGRWTAFGSSCNAAADYLEAHSDVVIGGTK